MVLIKTITMIEIYLVKDCLNRLMFVMVVNQEVDAEKKDGPITLKMQMIHIKK